MLMGHIGPLHWPAFSFVVLACNVSKTGLARLGGLRAMATGDLPAREMVRLVFAGNDSVLVPLAELALTWPYAAELGNISLDKADGSSWRPRRAAWFDYPLTDDGWWSDYDHSIIGDYNLLSMGNPNPLILSFAHYGWASTQVLTYENQENIIDSLQPDQWTNEKGPDAILASFGGDDIAGDQLAIYLAYGADSSMPTTRFQGVLASVRAPYEDLCFIRDQFMPDVPIFAQCYDYAIPNGVAANSLFGPWLKPSFDFALYQDLATSTQVVRGMIDQFYQILNDVASKTKDFYLVDTRGTIATNDWANELHPKSDGFNKLAQKLFAALRSQFPGQI
jgi:hypothetical protein